jgi:hypothetical protein
MGRPLPARDAGYRLHSQFKAYLCHDEQVGKRPARGGGRRPANARCGRKLPKRALLRAVNRALRPPGRVRMSRNSWLSAVERWYNHALGYFVQRGAVGSFVSSAGKRARQSPLRAHLKKYLGSDYPQEIRSILKALETAFRMTPLTGKEYAEAILNSKQRTTAVSRASPGYDAALAKWLFDDHNWVFLCSNKGGVDREFFAVPTTKERQEWPTGKNDWLKGDKSYLARIRRKLAECQKTINGHLNDLKLYQNKMGVGILAGDKAAIALLWASQQAVLSGKAKWQALLPLTKHDNLLKNTLMPIPQLWETPVNKVPKL